MANGTSLVPPQAAIQAVDTVLRNAPAFRYVQVGRSLFHFGSTDLLNPVQLIQSNF
jgi:hypothetical protein